MPTIAFITGGELETNSRRIWTGTSLGSAPVSGITGAHGKVYDTSSFPVSINFPATQIATGKTRWMFQTDSDNEEIMAFQDEGAGLQQVKLVYRSTGALEVVRQSTVLQSSAAGLFVPDTWYELELRARISNGAGSIAVNRNGAQIICVPSGVDTQSTSNAYTDTWTLFGGVLDSLWDDCVLDRAGTYLGTGQVETLMPNAAGDLTELAPDTIGPENWSRVDEKPHDSDTTYVASTASGQVDTYRFEPRAIAGTPLAVMLAAQVRHTAGSPSYRLVCRIDGENYESAAFATASVYDDYGFHCWNTNPATGEAWTDESINDAQWGIHCLAAGMRLTQLGLMVYVKDADSAQCIASGAARDYCESVDEDVN
jgi:hypothetical protein